VDAPEFERIENPGNMVRKNLLRRIDDGGWKYALQG